MGQCSGKQRVLPSPPTEWQTNPLKFIDKLDDVCSICHEEFNKELCFTNCCNSLFHQDCMIKYHEFMKSKRRIPTCPHCRDNMKSLI